MNIRMEKTCIFLYRFKKEGIENLILDESLIKSERNPATYCVKANCFLFISL